VAGQDPLALLPPALLPTEAAPVARRFVALDFETADYGADSACALALIDVRDGQIVERHSFLIRPPRRAFVFTWVHGIRWADVAEQPTFSEHWPRIREVLEGAEFLAAHNAPFDRGVLHACCDAAGVPRVARPIVCTVRIARRAFDLRRANLPAVCAHLGIPLKHHDALSDAEACAKIVLAGGTTHVEHQLAAAAAPPRRPRKPRALGS
jgi:DNA polymerase III subunit epsilon